MAKSALSSLMGGKKTKKDDDKKKLLSKASKKNKGGASAETVSLIRKGFDAVKENAKRIERERELASNRLYRTWLPDGEPKVFRFVNEEPITFYEHRVQLPNYKRPEFYTCLGEDCPLCAVADGRYIGKSRFVGAFLVIDRSEYEIKSGPNKGRKVKNQPRLYVEGQQTLSSLAQFSAKYESKGGLTGRDFEITRNDKARTIIPGEREKMSKEDQKTIKELLEKHGVKDVDALIVQQIEMQTLSREELEERFGTDEDERPVSKMRKI